MIESAALLMGLTVLVFHHCLDLLSKKNYKCYQSVEIESSLFLKSYQLGQLVQNSAIKTSLHVIFYANVNRLKKSALDQVINY